MAGVSLLQGQILFGRGLTASGVSLLQGQRGRGLQFVILMHVQDSVSLTLLVRPFLSILRGSACE